MEKLHVDCQCQDFNHVIRFNLDTEDGEIYIDTHLNLYITWSARLWAALKYVFGRPTKFGHYDCTMLQLGDYLPIMRMLNRSLDIKSAVLPLEQPTEKPVTEE